MKNSEGFTIITPIRHKHYKKVETGGGKSPPVYQEVQGRKETRSVYRIMEAVVLWGIFFVLIRQGPPYYFTDLGMFLIGLGIGSIITWATFEHCRYRDKLIDHVELCQKGYHGSDIQKIERGYE